MCGWCLRLSHFGCAPNVCVRHFTPDPRGSKGQAVLNPDGSFGFGRGLPRFIGMTNPPRPRCPIALVNICQSSFTLKPAHMFEAKELGELVAQGPAMVLAADATYVQETRSPLGSPKPAERTWVLSPVLSAPVKPGQTAENKRADVSRPHTIQARSKDPSFGCHFAGLGWVVWC